MRTSTVEDIRHVAYSLKKLEYGWDGYRAPPVPHHVIDEVVNTVIGMAGNRTLRMTNIIPGGDGSVQAEWYLMDAVIYYNVDPDGTRSASFDHRHIITDTDEFRYLGAEAWDDEALLLLAYCMERFIVAPTTDTLGLHSLGDTPSSSSP